MPNKRDSVKFIPSMSSKEHLHTLMEEEEEEEDEEQTTVLDMTITSTPVEEEPPVPFDVPATSVPSALVRHRPASLNLRPLSLLSGSPLQVELPTPSPSPNAFNARPGLRTLTLGASSKSETCKEASNDTPQSTDASWKRRSIVYVPPSGSISAPPRLVPLNTSGIQAPPPVAARRSSISYYSGSLPDIPSHGLPTPEMTPVSDRRHSLASTDSDSRRSSRPLSVSEQHFLFQAHQTLVQRISDLERALSARPRSRPQSCASDASSQGEAISDEMLQLVADLKAERDELKKDVDGWRCRLVDTEKQMSVLLKRVETERREAWVARERVSLIEVEKRAVEKSLQDKTLWGEEGWEKFRASRNELQALRVECDILRGQASRADEARRECTQLKTLLDAETRKREELEKELEGLLATPTPRAFEIPNKPVTTASRTMMFAKRGGLGFRSIDSVSSFTDVESVGSVDYKMMNLKAVEEEEEDDSRDMMSDYSTEENALAGYEDEEDNDHYAFHESSSASSLGSVEEFTAASGANISSESVPPLSSSRSSTASPAPPPSPPQPVVHNRQRSLSQAWIFPQDDGRHPVINQNVEIDRFFNCLEDLDNSPPVASLDSGKTLFSQALAYEDDEFPPFVLPSGFGIEVGSPELEPKTVLDVVLEEEEEEEGVSEELSVGPDDEFVGEEVEGGIVFTFIPPPSFEESDVPADTPDLSCDSSSTPDSSFSEEHNHSLSSVTSLTSFTSPSSIPRLMSAKRSSPSALPMSSTPVKSSRTVDCLRTPPPPSSSALTKRACSPADSRRSMSPSTPSKIPQPSFIPQPRRSMPSKAPVTLPTSRTTPALPKPSSMYASFQSLMMTCPC